MARMNLRDLGHQRRSQHQDLHQRNMQQLQQLQQLAALHSPLSQSTTVQHNSLQQHSQSHAQENHGRRQSTQQQQQQQLIEGSENGTLAFLKKCKMNGFTHVNRQTDRQTDSQTDRQKSNQNFLQFF